ncbi:TPR repeat-containing thioredoxin TTL2-like [Arachis stenosperma]|uniref:TPR repeat-containing thioredoxin TTL2-like n=1 Tax=Arachis stenosperma TaxID=217475 RepID=UPI0025AD1950|nr:TPR repeat-containing thioredoxin TTL2-like [Arachis stenosperma]
MAGKNRQNKKMGMGNEFGCGFMGGIIHLKSYWLKKSSVHSLPMKASNIYNASKKSQNTEEPKVRTRRNSTDTVITQKLSISDQKPCAKSTIVLQSRRLSDAARISTSTSASTSTLSNDDSKLQLAKINERNNKSPATAQLAGNLLVNNNTPRAKSLRECGPKSKTEWNSSSGKALMGNIMRKNSCGGDEFARNKKVVDPEVLKKMGNDAYKGGRFEEAVALYDRAIALDSSKATYHCNKSAALIGLRRFQEAVAECEESVRLEPSYTRAHNRLATIYFRLGEAEKALDCNQLTPDTDSALAFQTQTLQNHLNKCNEARKFNEWGVVLKETQSAISLGVDSSPQVYALQTEALLKLLRYQEAQVTYEKMPKFSPDWCNKIFGFARSSYQFMIAAQVYLAAGRFEDAVAAAQKAAKVDPSNREANAMLRKARAVTSARMSGNLLFKASKFVEASAVYNEGLDHNPHNSVLLCNRAACRSKLGQFEKAIEDCNAALIVQPSYSKARLRRADCNAKLQRWEVAIQDYEMLLREKPGDEEVARALFEAQLQLKMLRGEFIVNLKFGANLVFISNNDQFRQYVTSPGMAVVLFTNRAANKQVLLVLEQISKRFPSVNFLKVEIEDHPYLAKSEAVNSIPAFKIYKNGSRVKEISGKNHDLLEKSVQLYSG